MNDHSSSIQIEAAYRLAQSRYAELGVNTDLALERLGQIAISLHCWQGDDVSGFETTGGVLGGGLAATGNYPGKACSADELRQDLDKTYSLIPGAHRLNLHAIYAETGGRQVERTQLGPEHFTGWVDWARSMHHGLDFNPTFFSHPRAASGFTLSSYDPAVRAYWIEHAIACRKIGEYFGRQLSSPCITNVWIADGLKDTPVDRRAPRDLLKQSLDAVFAEKIDPRFNLDSIEGKLFGLGSESYVVGSHEFYLGYAIANHTLLTIDSGHYHPTETIADKISAVMTYLDEILLHVSRGVRWDSDHVVVLNDDTLAIAQEIVRGGYLGRIHIGLDYFDASINRIAAWTIGARALLKALLSALLEPIDQLRALEVAGDYTARLNLLEELKSQPAAAVWDYYLLQKGVPDGMRMMEEIRNYEKSNLINRRMG